MLVFIICLVEFLLHPAFATSVFFVILVMALLRCARRCGGDNHLGPPRRRVRGPVTAYLCVKRSGGARASPLLHVRRLVIHKHQIPSPTRLRSRAAAESGEGSVHDRRGSARTAPVVQRGVGLVMMWVSEMSLFFDADWFVDAKLMKWRDRAALAIAAASSALTCTPCSSMSARRLRKSSRHSRGCCRRICGSYFEEWRRAREAPPEDAGSERPH